MNRDIILSKGTNLEFLNQHARPGLIGLAGGDTLIDKTITRAQRHLDTDRRWSHWSHAFLCQGLRADGHHWVVESDLELHRKHIRLGVQENRISKYYDAAYYTRLAVLDFHLTPDQFNQVLCKALDLVSARTRYSLRELMGAVLGLRHPSLRERDNVFSRSSSFFCSAFIAHLFRHAGLEIQPGLPDKHTTPEDIFRSLAPHTVYILDRSPA